MWNVDVTKPSRPALALALARLVLPLATLAACQSKPEPIPPSSPTTFVQLLPVLDGTFTSDRIWNPPGQTASRFSYRDRFGVLTGATRIHTIHKEEYTLPAHLTIAVEEGRLRGYLLSSRDVPRPAVMSVKDMENYDAQRGFVYVEATPGHPANLSGEMLTTGTFVLQAVDAPAKGVTYRIWRESPGVTEGFVKPVLGIVILVVVYRALRSLYRRVFSRSARP
jgi:hypothetical protein